MCKKLSLNVNRARFTLTFDDRYPWQQCTSALVAGYLRAAQRLLAAPFSASGHSFIFEACSSSLPMLRRHNLLNAAFLPVFSVIIPSPTLLGCSNWPLSLSFRTKLAFLPFSNRGKNAVLSREFRVSRNTNRNTKNSAFVFLFPRVSSSCDDEKDYIYRVECDEDYVRQFVICKTSITSHSYNLIIFVSRCPRTKLVPVGETSCHLMI